jgi:hypothetical protein
VACLLQPPPPYPQATEYYPTDWSEIKRAEFDRVVKQLDIQPFYLSELRQILTGSKKVFVIDNSGSMARGLTMTHMERGQYANGVVRRIDELIAFVKTAVPILALDSPDGVDFWFLNRPDGNAGPVLVPGVQAYEQVRQALEAPPLGGTPLVATLQAVQARYAPLLGEQGVHCIIATDGEPTEGPQALYDLVMRRPHPHTWIINFLICTDDDDGVEYLDHLDKHAPVRLCIPQPPPFLY